MVNPCISCEQHAKCKILCDSAREYRHERRQIAKSKRKNADPIMSTRQKYISGGIIRPAI